MTRPVQIRAKARPPATSRPFLLELGVRYPFLTRAGVVASMRLPQGRLRRAIGEWGVREVGIGSITRGDFEAIRALAGPGFTVIPAPELAAILGQPEVIVGVEAGVAFLEAWFESWGEFHLVPQEGIDLGDGRVAVLNHMRGRGATSGAAVISQEEAELWETRRGLVVRVRQWWSWDEALAAIGVEPARRRRWGEGSGALPGSDVGRSRLQM